MTEKGVIPKRYLLKKSDSNDMLVSVFAIFGAIIFIFLYKNLPRERFK